MKLKVAYETIVEEIYRNQFHRGRGTLNLKQLIEACHRKEEVLPDNIFYSMYHIRNLGNLGAHPNPFAERQTKEILSSLATVMEWYAHKKGL